jgi:hypothetical protein
VEKPGEIHRGDELVVRRGVLGERLGDEDAGIVDQRVDPAEPLDRRRHDPVGGRGFGDVTGDGGHARVIGRCDRACVRHHRIAESAVGVDQGGPHPLRGTGDERDFLRCARRRS